MRMMHGYGARCGGNGGMLYRYHDNVGWQEITGVRAGDVSQCAPPTKRVETTCIRDYKSRHWRL